MADHPRCDVLLTKTGRVFVNGIEIGFITEIDYNHGRAHGLPELRVSMRPTSIIQGEPPTSEIERLHRQVVSDPTAKVDITKAIENAKARMEGSGRVGGKVDEVPEAGR